MKLVEFHCSSMLCTVVLLAMSSASMADDATAARPAASGSAAAPTAIYLHGDCQPQVPDEARRAGTHGVTRIKFTISPAGEVTSAEVIQSSGPTALHRKLDHIAVAALRTCPVRVGHDENGNPVGAELVATYAW